MEIGTEPAGTTCSEQIAWLEFYRAIVNDDAETVKRTLNYRDYRLKIDDGKSGLEVAIRLGSANVVKVFLDHLAQYHGIYERYRVLVHACFSACIGKRTEMLRSLLEAIRPVMGQHYEAEHFLNIYDKAVESNSPELMDILEEFTEIDTKEISLIRRCFVCGNRPLFKRLFAVGCRTPEQLAEEMPVPIIFIYIALGEQELVRRKIEDDPEWCAEVPFGNDGSGNSTTQLNPFRSAGNFRDMEILELLYDRAKEIVFPVDDWLEKDFNHAIFHDGLELIQWLKDKDICDLKRPYEVDVQCTHCYPHIDPNGRVFKYLQESTEDEDMTDEEIMERIIKVIYDVVAHGSPALVDWYLSFVQMEPSLALICLKASVASDRPLFVERFLRHVDFDCDDVFDTVHEVLCYTYQSGKKRNRRLPSPAVTEQILAKLPRGSTCRCGESIFLDLFFDMEHLGGNSHRGENVLPVSLICHHVRILMEQMVSRGARPKLKTMKRTLFSFLSNMGACSIETCFGARVICLLDWYDITELIQPFTIDQCAIWFIRKFDDRDAVLSLMLMCLCGVEATEMRWDGLLVYILNPRGRRRQYVKLIHELGLSILDKYLERVSDEMKQSSGYRRVVELTKARVLSLQSLSRIEIYRGLRQKMTEYRKTHDEYVPMSNFVTRWAAAKGLPRQVVDFLKFSDCMDNWNDNYQPHIHESVRDLVFDVSEVLFLHPLLRDTTEEDDD